MDQKDYGKKFYERAISQEGVDYAFYGDWQKDYAKMVVDITDILKAATDDRKSLLIDVGCACGVTLKGFKETKVFGECIGYDISQFLIDKGKEVLEFSDEELIRLDITEEFFPLADDSVTLLHCSHVLEHIPEDKLDFVLEEFNRVLAPDTGYGLLVIPTIKPGNPRAEVEREETHVNIQTMNWWRSKLASVFDIDNNVRKNFKASKFSPIADPEKTFHHFYNKGWTLFGLKKKEK